MIDTDKYEGHKPAPWRWFGMVNSDGAILLVDADDHGLPLFKLNGEPTELDRPDVKLIADAPLLLAEVLRLHEGIKFFLDIDKQPSRAELLELIK